MYDSFDLFDWELFHKERSIVTDAPLYPFPKGTKKIIVVRDKENYSIRFKFSGFCNNSLDKKIYNPIYKTNENN